MDNEALRLIARLQVSAARVGQTIDVVRFAADRNYARVSMQQFAAATDEQGTLLVLQLMDKLAMTAPLPPPRQAAEPVAAETASNSAKNDIDPRYIGPLR